MINIESSFESLYTNEEIEDKKKCYNSKLLENVVTFFSLSGIFYIILFGSFFWGNSESYKTIFKQSIILVTIITTVIYFVIKHIRFLKSLQAKRNIYTYTILIKEYFCQNISNTEYYLYTCKTIENRIVKFQSKDIIGQSLKNTIKVKVSEGKLLSIKTFLTENVNLIQVKPEVKKIKNIDLDDEFVIE